MLKCETKKRYTLVHQGYGGYYLFLYRLCYLGKKGETVNHYVLKIKRPKETTTSLLASLSSQVFIVVFIPSICTREGKRKKMVDNEGG